jgi:hypothetical protein
MASDWGRFLALLRGRTVDALDLERKKTTDGPEYSEYEILQILDGLVMRRALDLSRDNVKLRSFDDWFDLDTNVVEPGVFWCNLYQAAYRICSADSKRFLEEFGLELSTDTWCPGPIVGYMALLQCGLGHGRSFDLTTIMIACFDNKAQAALQDISMRRGVELLGLVYTIPIAARNPPVRFGWLAYEVARIVWSTHQANGATSGDDSILPAYEDAARKVFAHFEEQERRLKALADEVHQHIRRCQAARERPW